MPRTILVVLLLAAIGALGYALLRAVPDPERRIVTVAAGTVVRKAVASGQVEPSLEAQVNTQLAGFVHKVAATLGQRVAAGDALCEVWPTLTERDLLSAERSLQGALEGEETAREFVQGEHLLSHLTRMLQGERNLERMQRSAERGRRSAEESLRLLREGKVEIDGHVVDFVVRARTAGHVLQIVREGDPVTPASSYGVGTVIAVLGDLDNPVFRGTVDEIDVGRLQTGMTARISLGALPGTVLSGKVLEIGLRARRVDNASLFDIRVAVEKPPDLVLRAGYSATAEIELQRATDVLVVPERVVEFAGGATRVELRGADGRPVTRAVELGLSDGLLVEVRSGLAAGDAVYERGAAR